MIQSRPLLSLVNICGIPTHVYELLGNKTTIQTDNIINVKHRITNSSSSSSSIVKPDTINDTLNIRENEIVIMIIPGNPGIGGFYIPFANHLYNLCQKQVTITIVSHAGHAPGTLCSNSKQRYWYNLQDQINHKLSYIENNIGLKTRLILIGHSIGSYMILNMLEKFHNIEHSFLLFPTIERMSQSPSGQRLTNLFPYLRFFIPFLIYLFNFLLPNFIKLKILKYYFNQTPEQDRQAIIDATLTLFNWKTCYQMLSMSNEEMLIVQKCQHNLIEKFISKITFYYGKNDHWVPEEIYDQMKILYPHGDIKKCINKYEHAFVLKHSKELANFVYEKMKNKL